MKFSIIFQIDTLITKYGFWSVLIVTYFYHRAYELQCCCCTDNTSYNYFHQWRNHLFQGRHILCLFDGNFVCNFFHHNFVFHSKRFLGNHTIQVQDWINDCFCMSCEWDSHYNIPNILSNGKDQEQAIEICTSADKF